jgi:hypothetical protein
LSSSPAPLACSRCCCSLHSALPYCACVTPVPGLQGSHHSACHPPRANCPSLIYLCHPPHHPSRRPSVGTALPCEAPLCCAIRLHCLVSLPLLPYTPRAEHRSRLPVASPPSSPTLTVAARSPNLRPRVRWPCSSPSFIVVQGFTTTQAATSRSP